MAKKSTLATLQMTSWSVLLVVVLILLLLAANFWLKVDSQDLQREPTSTEEATFAIQSGGPSAADFNSQLDALAAFGPRPEDAAGPYHPIEAELANTPIITASR